MKNLFILSIFIFAGACSFNKNSTYWNEDPAKKRIEDNERDTVIGQRRAIRASADMNAGSIVSRYNTFPLRPCPVDGIQPCDISEIEGKKLTRNIKKGDIIRISDLI